VAWMRDSDANPESKVDLSIVTRHWNGSSWQAEQTVANDPTSQDSQPVIQYNTDGSEAWVLWTRDHDGDFNTNPDRKLAYAIWNGSSWSAAVEPSNWPTGAYNGQMVFSTASDKPLVTMIVLGDLGKDDAGNDLGQATIGKEGRLYAAWHGGSASGWDVQSVHDTRAESAQPILASPNRALILMRNFGGGGSDGYPSAGRMAISAGEINPDGARWVAPGLLTEGELPVWQVQGISVPLGDPSDADFGINFVGVEQDTDISNGRAVELARGVEATVATADHVRATNLAGTNQTKILDFETATNGADLELEPLEFSNLAPLPGEVVVVTATVRSKTVRPMSWTDGGPQFRITLRSLRDGLNENIQLHTELVPVDLLFNETETVVMSYRSTGDSGRILAQVSFTGDIDTSNNDYYQRVGEHTAPLNLAVNELFDKTTLSWDSPIRQTPTSWFYHIYRGPSAEGPWTFYDLSKQPEYTDNSPDSDNSYYAVEAFDQYKQRSDQVVGTGSEPPLLPLTTGETQVSFSTSEALVHETGGNAMLTVNLSEPLLTQVTVDYAASSGTATVGSDLANASGTITFNPGETVKMISVPITNDNNNEGNETFIVTLSNSIGTLIGSKDTVTVEIMDDDDGVPDAPSVSLSAAAATVSENAGELIVTVNLSNAWTQAVTVKIGTSSSTADSGSDFGGQSQTLTFVPGVTSRTLTIPIINDNWVETSETFTVTLSDPAGMTLGSVTTTTVTIIDDGDTKTPGEDVYLPLIVR
ncbi:MAG: Calx-beta domain-containing protein, partial [Anaerolineae bacterium]